MHLEEVLERYEQALRDGLPRPAVRAHLAPLFEESATHARLRKSFADRSLRATSGAPSDPDEILQTIVDCERMAHEFYLHYLDRLSDPELVELFKDLSREELEHLKVAEEARALSRQLETRAST